MVVIPITQKKEIVAALQNMEAIFLDFDGTVVDFTKSEKQAFYHLWGEQGKITNQELAFNEYVKINKELWNAFSKNELSIEMVLEQRFSVMKQRFKLQGDPKDLDVRFRQLLVEYTVLPENTYNAIKALKEKGIRILIVTNGVHETQVLRIKKIGLHNIIDGLITSQQVGSAKPDPKIFQIALQQTGVQEKKTWMIGDSLQTDILGGNAMGLYTCYISQTTKKAEEEIKQLHFHEKPHIIASSLNAFISYYMGITDP